MLGTWASIQWAPTWADKLTNGLMPDAKSYTQIWSAVGAIVGTIVGALMCDWIGRRLAYVILCIGSLGATLLLFQGNTEFGPQLLACRFPGRRLNGVILRLAAVVSAGVIPDRMRATGQGSCFNFGRILAAIGVLQSRQPHGPNQGMIPDRVLDHGFCILVGVIIIWFAPEMRGKPLPE